MTVTTVAVWRLGRYACLRTSLTSLATHSPFIPPLPAELLHVSPPSLPRPARPRHVAELRLPSRQARRPPPRGDCRRRGVGRTYVVRRRVRAERRQPAL